jgi:hypothetical protein
MSGGDYLDQNLPAHLRRRALADATREHEMRTIAAADPKERYQQIRDPSRGIDLDHTKWTRNGKRIFDKPQDDCWYEY